MTTAQRQEWHTTDKSSWGPGDWQREPDKAQWIDEATGLDCLIVRNSIGSLCGYVGVPEGHPWRGNDYDTCDVRVHGGLTFASGCQESTREQWELMRKRFPEYQTEAAKYPDGDAAKKVRDLTPLLDDYEGWRDWDMARSICHVPAKGRPDKVYWFGFDCGHFGDMSPGYDRKYLSFLDGTYRDLDYVTSEVTNLAAQLAAVTT